MSQSGVRISAVGHYAPPRIVTNADFERWLDTSDEWITSRTGMHRRHWVDAETKTSDLACEAATRALAKVDLAATDIDCYIVATATPDYMFPATACLVAARLGAQGKAAFDIEIACSGFIYGLTVASSLIRSGIHKRVMLIGAETLSRLINHEDRSTAILFGDGAGAVILESSTQDSFLSAELGSDGSNPEVLHAGLSAHQQFIHMNGREVFKFAVQKMISATDLALEKAHLAKSDLDFLIPHQANRRIIDAAAKYLGMPPEKVVVNIQEYGNTSAASIPMALSEALDQGRISAGNAIVFVGFGGGLSWGAVTWRWAA